MVWDILNGMISYVVGTLTAIYSILPQSPLYVPSAVQTALAVPLGYAAFFVPITAAIAILGIYMVGLISWFLVIATIHFVEQITP